MQYASAHATHVGFKGDRTVSLADTKLHSKLQRSLRNRMKIKHLFDMQDKIFSHVQTLMNKHRTGDIVLRAPTGSGKTLAYALPITHALIDRIVPRLRVVVVVPTRDLANQVMGVFKTLTEATGIYIEAAVGASSLTAESSAVCKAEVLVATPGRLVYHVDNTEDFDLSHVKFLVLDESDRLLEDSYQDWITKLLPLLGHYSGEQRLPDDDIPRKGPVMGMFALAMVPDVTARINSKYSGLSQESVWKFLVSATQTTNPMRLHNLDLRNPTFFQPDVTTANEQIGVPNTGSACTVPPTLVEKGWVVKELHEKPAGLLVLLGWVRAVTGEKSRRNDQGMTYFKRRGVKLVFTHSVEASHRLCRLLELYSFSLNLKGEVLEMSGELPTERRAFVLNRINELSKSTMKGESESEEFLIVVCSDLLARGMDMVCVDTIINYDAPVHINKYLHRAGRTARAGRPGTVHTLMLERQAHHFRKMVREADRGERKVVTKNLTAEFAERSNVPEAISRSLSSLRRVLKREGLGLLDVAESIPSYVLEELHSHAITNVSPNGMHEEGDYIQGANSLLENNYSSHKKRLREAEPDQGITDRGRDLTYEEGISPTVDEDNGDAFTDLLFCQIARGLGKPLSTS